jgi:hypothetical protein
MNVLGYGEDALTLWALTQRTEWIVSELDDPNPPSSCTLLFRPSFGRRGGPTSSQFGEFDFILASPTCLYLGESKWDLSPEIAERTIVLRQEQTERHTVFAEYYRLWVSAPAWEWRDFLTASGARFAATGIGKPAPPVDSLLSRNLHNTLEVVSSATGRAAQVRNVLLVVDTRGTVDPATKTAPPDFTLIVMNVSGEMEGCFIPIMGRKRVEPEGPCYGSQARRT